MRIAQSLGTLCVVLVVSTSLTAQVTEVGAPQRAFSLVDVDLLGATLPTAEAMNSVGGNLGATLRLVGGAAVVGGARQVYDQGTSNGAALAALGTMCWVTASYSNGATRESCDGRSH